MADPWPENNVSGPLTTKFEDDFLPAGNKLPDHAQYLAILEAKLRKLKSDPGVLRQLREKREACMRQLLAEDSDLEPALSQGEAVELLKHDQLLSMTTPLLFLLKLAWDCRYRLPLLITVGFMVLDVRMQLDINVQMREVPRAERRAAPPDQGDNLSDSSWTTFEEQEVDLNDE